MMRPIYCDIKQAYQTVLHILTDKRNATYFLIFSAYHAIFINEVSSLEFR